MQHDRPDVLFVQSYASINACDQRSVLVGIKEIGCAFLVISVLFGRHQGVCSSSYIASNNVQLFIHGNVLIPVRNGLLPLIGQCQCACSNNVLIPLASWLASVVSLLVVLMSMQHHHHSVVFG
jgi:hypothetical protein